MLMTQKLLDADFLVSYAADACVYHLHDFTWKQQYRRNYIVGQMLQRYHARIQNVQEYGEGKKLAMSVFKTLIKEGRILECILRVMRKLNLLLVILRCRPYTRYQQAVHKYPNLLDRNFDQAKPNQFWVTDIAYIPIPGNMLYMCAVLDLCEKSHPRVENQRRHVLIACYGHHS